MDKHTYTEIDGIHVCNDCGAYGEEPDEVVHFPNCVPGSSQKEMDANNARDLEQEARDDEEYRRYLNE